MKRLTARVFPLLWLSGCATTSGYEAVLETWGGDTTDHLVSVWGAPDQVYPLTNGGKVLQYTRSSQVVLPGITTYQPVTTYTSGDVTAFGPAGTATGSYDGTSTTYVPHTSEPTVIPQQCTTRFTADATGRIVQWAWQGNACRAVAPPKRAATQPAPAPAAAAYPRCTADQIRTGTCS